MWVTRRINVSKLKSEICDSKIVITIFKSVVLTVPAENRNHSDCVTNYISK